MEILDSIDIIEDTIEKGLNIPLAGKCMLDKDELLDLIQDIRLKLPDDLKQAKWVKDERQRILVDAQKEANEIIKSTEDKIISMINENEITKRAKEKADELINAANKRAKEIRQSTRQYADDVLADMEKIIEKTIQTLRDNRISLHDKEQKKQDDAQPDLLDE